MFVRGHVVVSFVTSMRMIGYLLATLLLSANSFAAVTTAPADQVEQWGVFELSLNGPAEGHPFDLKLSAQFINGSDKIEARGFYDGDDVYRIRFMPPRQGVWRYQTTSDATILSGKSGQFTCTKPSPGNHGPVLVHNTYHFAYADGLPFVPISTTLYGWAQQRSDELKQQTLDSLKQLPFNRVRMMVFPIAYGKDNQPPFLPFETNPDGNWNFEKLNPTYFRDYENRIAELRDMGIQAELILFHNRDGNLTQLDRMSPEADDRYVRYVVARFSSFRNVWWSLANEFDSLRYKRDDDWDRFFRIIQAEDPSQHLRSVHQMRRYYDFNKPWVTHMSVQSELAVTGFGRPVIYRQLSRKPVIFDEMKYEGDIPDGWGHLSAEEMVQRFWVATVSGTYATHGETFAGAPGVRWISRGGKLVGQSPARIAFLRDVLATAPADGLEPFEPQDETRGIAGRRGAYYLVYFGASTPTQTTLQLPGVNTRDLSNWKIDVLDTWNMTIEPARVTALNPTSAPTTATSRPSGFGPLSVTLPGKPYIALRLRRGN